MAQIFLPIKVEVAKPNFFQAIVAKQYDNDSRWLEVTFVNEKDKIFIYPDSAAMINAKRNDGEEMSFKGEVMSDGTVVVPLTSWMLELAGTLECDISVINWEGKKLTSTKFTVEVERASCSDQSITEDENYGVLVDLLTEVRQVKADATAAVSEAEAAASVARSASSAAGNATKAANDAASSATEAISNLSTALKNTSEAINRADIAAYQASKAAENANDAATKATGDVADALQVLNPLKEEAILAVDNAHSKAQEAASAASSANAATGRADTAATNAETAAADAIAATNSLIPIKDETITAANNAHREATNASSAANEATNAANNAKDVTIAANAAVENANSAAALARGAAESANKAAGLPFYVYAEAGFLSNNTVSFDDPIGLIGAITTAYQSGRQVILIANADIDYDLPKVPLIMPMKFIVSNMMAVFSVMWQKKSYEITILGESYVANKYEF